MYARGILGQWLGCLVCTSPLCPHAPVLCRVRARAPLCPDSDEALHHAPRPQFRDPTHAYPFRTESVASQLPYRVRWQDLKDLFRRAGTVLRADVALGPDNRSRGHGTVLLASQEDAERAISMFQGWCWQGRVLEVRKDRVISGEEGLGVGSALPSPMAGAGFGAGLGSGVASPSPAPLSRFNSGMGLGECQSLDVELHKLIYGVPPKSLPTC